MSKAIQRWLGWFRRAVRGSGVARSLPAPSRLVSGSGDGGARGDADSEVGIEGVREALEHRQTRDRAGGLEPRYGGLRHARCGRELGLTPPALLPQAPQVAR